MDVMGISDTDLRLVPGRSLHAGEHVIPVDTMGRMLLRWYPAAPPYRDLSYYDVFEERVGEPEKIFAEGVCIVGATAPALGDMKPTPMLILMPGSEIHTILFSNLSRGDFASAMGDGMGFLLTIILGGLMSWLAVRFPGLFGTSLMVILLLLFIAVAFVSYLNWSYWMEMLRPAIGLMSGYIAAFISTR
jgi:adenylate cyclase